MRILDLYEELRDGNNLLLLLELLCKTNLVCFPPGVGGGVLPEKLGRGVRPLPRTLALFMTKICDIPYPIYDLTKNWKPYV